MNLSDLVLLFRANVTESYFFALKGQIYFYVSLTAFERTKVRKFL